MINGGNRINEFSNDDANGIIKFSNDDTNGGAHRQLTGKTREKIQDLIDNLPVSLKPKGCIIAGGAGGRLLSVIDHAKQFQGLGIKLFAYVEAQKKKTKNRYLKKLEIEDRKAELTGIIQSAIYLIMSGIKPEDIQVLVCREDQYNLACQQLAHIGVLSDNIFIDCSGEGFAGSHDVFLRKRTIDRDAAIAIIPADGYYKDVVSISDALSLAIYQVTIDNAVKAIDIGIYTTNPEVAGRSGVLVPTNHVKDISSVYSVDSFVEKPGTESARQLIGQSEGKGVAVSTAYFVTTANYALQCVTEPFKGNDTGVFKEKFGKGLYVLMLSPAVEWRDLGTLLMLYNTLREEGRAGKMHLNVRQEGEFSNDTVNASDGCLVKNSTDGVVVLTLSGLHNYFVSVARTKGYGYIIIIAPINCKDDMARKFSRTLFGKEGISDDDYEAIVKQNQNEGFVCLPGADQNITVGRAGVSPSDFMVGVLNPEGDKILVNVAYQENNKYYVNVMAGESIESKRKS